MSEENVELARRYVEAFNAGGLDGTQHQRHPDIEVFDPPDFPDADRYVGEAAVRQIVESYLELGWDGQFRVEEYLDAGEEVVVIWHLSGRTLHGGGLPIDQTCGVSASLHRALGVVFAVGAAPAHLTPDDRP